VVAVSLKNFRGTLEKIEPQAVVEQNVTMFPVIVSLDNSSGLLRPGMNAEVAILIDDAINVLLVPNNAVVQPSDVGPAALALGLDVDALDLTQFMRAGRGGRGVGARDGAPAPGQVSQAPAVTSETSSQVPSSDAAPMERIQQLRAQAERGEISQDSVRAAMRALRAASGFAGRRPGSASEPSGSDPSASRPAVVFVVNDTGEPEPHLVQVGLNDWDYTEVVSGLEGGETLAVVGPAQLQAQQQEFLDRMRSRAGGSPFGGGAPRGRGGR
jgi:HlyD family secretion protein